MSHPLLRGLALFALLVAPFPAPLAPAAGQTAAGPARRPSSPTALHEIVAVIDGDTLHVRRAGRIEKLRLLSVDTEEKISANPDLSASKPETVFGEQTKLWAERFFADLAAGGAPARIGLLFPAGREERDAYGRLLCHALLPDGTDYNLLLVREGWSPYFTKYGYSEIAHADFAAAQAAAQREKRGIWDPRTNRPATPGAPAAARPYARLLPWWDARAQAVAEFRARRTADPARAIDAEDSGALAAGVELCRRAPGEEVEVFGTIERFFTEKNGDWTVLFASPAPDGALRVRVPREARAGLAALDLPATTAEFRQNYLWVRGSLARERRGFVLEAPDPAQWRIASPAVAESAASAR
ncbi:MAG: thermonuclease family protein [Planctomycetota bacterium]